MIRFMSYALKVIPWTIVLTLSQVLSLSLFAQTKMPSSTNCEINPLQCSILTLRPDMSGAESLLLSNLIYKYSKKYNVDPYRVIAIAYQESRFKNNEIALNKNGTVDVGVFQFNTGTIIYYKLDALKLKTDLNYATEKACFLLREKVKLCEIVHGSAAWSCYNSIVEKHRKRYEMAVDKWYQLINPTVINER